MRLYAASSAQIKRTEDWEARVRYWYRDIVGVWTGGAGHTEPNATVRASVPAPFSDAVIDGWLRGDFAVAERALALLMVAESRALAQNVVDGALDGGFNCGTGLLTASSSGFARALLAWDFAAASREILRWCMVVGKDGKKVPNAGLLNRRRAEAALILSPDAPHPDTSSYDVVCAGAICNPDELHELDQRRLALFIQASRDEDYGARDLHDGSDPLDDGSDPPPNAA